MVREVTGRLGLATRVLRGACDDMLAPPPLQPFRDAVRGTDGPLARALAGGLDLYEPVIQEFGGSAQTVLVIEDVHWADDATLDLLTKTTGVQAAISHQKKVAELTHAVHAA